MEVNCGVSIAPMSPGGEKIEVVRGALHDLRPEQIVRFWVDKGALNEEAARDRLPGVVCVARDEGGEIVAVNSVYEAMPRPPARPMYVYRSFLAEDSDELWSKIFTAAFDVLDAEYDRDGGGPLGVCVLLDGAEAARRPEALWPDEDLIFAGHLPDGRQVRIRWFWDATAGPGLPNSMTLDQSVAMDWSIDERYRVEPYTGDPDVANEILALWAREGVVREDEARRRVHETLNVVLDRDEGVVALSTGYIQRNEQLGLDLWYFRTFVSTPHRNTHIATQLTMHNRDLLESRFMSGEDTRASGVCFELENEGMRKYLNMAIWRPVEFIFVGDNERGIPVRVHYFPGARVPLPRPTPTA
jgi:hypothetical protein